MNKTQLLVSLVLNNESKIDGAVLYRRTMSGEWVRSTKFRKDVVVRAAAILSNMGVAYGFSS